MAGSFMNVILENSFRIMLSGFGVSAVGLFTYVYFMYKDPGTAKIAFGVAIAGFCIYVIGRICLFIKNKKQNKTALPQKDLKDAL